MILYQSINQSITMLSLSSISLIFLNISAIFFQFCNARVFTFEMHHRYSEQVKIWSQKNYNHPRYHHSPHYYHHLHHHWPKKGSFEYYSDLAQRDRFLRGRKMSQLDEPVTFSDGNSTFRISSLGFLHYTTVTLGTPGVKFLVALDTGSDLFWVPCDCSRCAPLEGASYAYDPDFELSIYNPKASSTSTKVSCNDTLCLHHNNCLGSFSHCPYVISYVSAETSTSGILVEDVMHLTTEEHHPESVEAYITFGCGQVQTGSFLDVAAPNGLFGLGMENISVPSILSRKGFIANSFSMCFGRDGVGRISFGDKGSPDQKETPFNVNPLHPSYNITLTQIQVGTALNDVEFTALFDSGTSFTYLVDPFYTNLARNFDLQIKDKRRPADSRLPFEYCYDMRPDANTSLVPTVSFSMEGGGQYRIYDPIIVISTQIELVYCLAVVKSKELSIIGQNFMTGYHIVFDREKLSLGWEKSDCYDIEDFKPSVGGKETNDTRVPPAVAAQPDNITQGATGSTYHSSAPSPTCLWHFCEVFISLITLFFMTCFSST
ncbi:aspartyl protease family protein 1-like isoform X1 [Chenopodium quinoa]|uniref:aspartyl protease family protein 1-like isoform X1 n=1 Tax=Chenopodium quinoa TaxID=63459 RepID=UPI000B77F30A|nr:aspartyl protease family protein 1-like isoform X1 [Chenopodium quinoa]